MDSITQAALGASLAGAVAGKTLGRSVLLTGAVLGTLPDLDVVKKGTCSSRPKALPWITGLPVFPAAPEPLLPDSHRPPGC